MQALKLKQITYDSWNNFSKLGLYSFLSIIWIKNPPYSLNSETSAQKKKKNAKKVITL